jgi:hypothetical protein
MVNQNGLAWLLGQKPLLIVLLIGGMVALLWFDAFIARRLIDRSGRRRTESSEDR